MKTKKLLFIFIGILLITTACMNNKKDNTLSLEPTGNQSLPLSKLSSKGITDQQPADQAKQFLSNYEEITRVRAVNHDNDLLIAIEVDHLDRFQLDDIEREVRKKIKSNFSNLNITISSDKKILLELRDLETVITEKKISEDDIKKRITEIKKLSKEQT